MDRFRACDRTFSLARMEINGQCARLSSVNPAKPGRGGRHAGLAGPPRTPLEAGRAGGRVVLSPIT